MAVIGISDDRGTTMCAGGVMVSIVPIQEVGRGSIPTAALHDLRLIPISREDAKKIIVRNHYSHSIPGGTKMCFGIILNGRLLGAMTFGVGPFYGYKLVNGATPDDAITLTRLWLSDELPRNSESKVLGIALRSLKRDTSLKFVIAYSDPAVGHLGIIYQATGWVYTGLSSATPLYDIGDGTLHHSRSLAHELGSHSIRYLTLQGINAKIVPQSAKHRYIYFLDKSWSSRLAVPVLPYPKKGV
jgi:hypothetical protein